MGGERPSSYDRAQRGSNSGHSSLRCALSSVRRRRLRVWEARTPGRGWRGHGPARGDGREARATSTRRHGAGTPPTAGRPAARYADAPRRRRAGTHTALPFSDTPGKRVPGYTRVLGHSATNRASPPEGYAIRWGREPAYPPRTHRAGIARCSRPCPGSDYAAQARAGRPPGPRAVPRAHTAARPTLPSRPCPAGHSFSFAAVRRSGRSFCRHGREKRRTGYPYTPSVDRDDELGRRGIRVGGTRQRRQFGTVEAGQL